MAHVVFKTKKGHKVEGEMTGWKLDAFQVLDANGGYIEDYKFYPFKWDVKCGFDASLQTVLPHAVKQLKHEYGNKISDAQLKTAIFQIGVDYDAQRVWDETTDDMYEILSDDDMRKMARFEIAQRWGIDPDEAFDIEFRRVGRSGGHLIMTEFEGVSLKFDLSTDFVQHVFYAFQNGDNTYSNAWLRKLTAYIQECNILFAPAEIQSEFYHRAGWLVKDMLIDQVNRVKE